MSIRIGEWRPLGPQTEPRMTEHDVICLHTMAGSLAGTDAMFRQNGYGGTESHFGVGGRGLIYQWQDTAYQADANLQGNPRVLSVETADWGEEPFGRWDTSNAALIPAWTAEQVGALAVITAQLAEYYLIPLQLIPDSAPGRRGVGYHRLGCDPYRVPGGERWSAAAGKVCPGDRRIAQVPEVIARARQLAGGDPPPAQPTTAEDDPVTPIELHFYNDAGAPDPAGLNFRGACPAETSANSMVIDRAWVRWVSYWGATTWRIVAWSAAKAIAEAPTGVDNWELPAKDCRGFTVEGRRANPGVQPAASLLVALK